MGETVEATAPAIYNVRDFGGLLRLIRESRGVDPKYLANQLKIWESDIARIEIVSISRGARSAQSKHVYGIIKALKQSQIDGCAVNFPLSDEQAKLLFDLYTETNTRAKLRQQYHDLKNINFSFFDETVPGEHRDVVQEVHKILRESKYPAFIADSLWFVHALNRSAFNFFVAPNLKKENKEPEDFLRSWEAWHLIAGKLVPNSPIWKVYRNYNSFFPQTIDVFVKNIYPYLFSPQVQALQTKLQGLATKKNIGFSLPWNLAIKFLSPFETGAVDRGLVHEGKPLQAEADEQIKLLEHFPNLENEALKQDLRHYWIGIWNPKGKDAQAIFEGASAKSSARDIYFAADYDHNKNFHVNRWTEVDALYKAMNKPQNRKRSSKSTESSDT